MRHTLPVTKTNLATDWAWKPAIYQSQRAINEKWSPLSIAPFCNFLSKLPFFHLAPVYMVWMHPKSKTRIRNHQTTRATSEVVKCTVSEMSFSHSQTHDLSTRSPTRLEVWAGECSKWISQQRIPFLLKSGFCDMHYYNVDRKLWCCETKDDSFSKPRCCKAWYVPVWVVSKMEKPCIICSELVLC